VVESELQPSTDEEAPALSAVCGVAGGIGLVLSVAVLAGSPAWGLLVASVLLLALGWVNR
jgi:hypothetical protein